MSYKSATSFHLCFKFQRKISMTLQRQLFVYENIQESVRSLKSRCFDIVRPCGCHGGLICAKNSGLIATIWLFLMFISQ